MEKENENNQKETSKNIKKGKKLLKILSIIIIVLVILFCIHIIRNFIIINKIFNKQAEYKDVNNYSYTSEYYSAKEDDEKTVIETYYKDGKSKLIRKGEKEISVFYDNDTKECIFVDNEEKEATIDYSETMLGVEKPIALETTLQEKLLMALLSFIRTETVNGEECYYITQGDYNKSYVSKETGIGIKNISGKAVIDGKEYDSITEIKNWKINQVIDENVTVPDISEYKIIKNE